MSARKRVRQGTQEATESAVDQNGVADPELVNGSGSGMHVASGLPDAYIYIYMNPQPFPSAPHDRAESFHVQSPTMGRNDGDFDFPATFTATENPVH